MKKKMVKGAGGVFLCWIGLIAVVCVPSFVAGVMYSKPCMPMALLNATVAELENDDLLSSNTVASAAGGGQAAQPGQWQTARMPTTAHCLCPKCCGRNSDSTTASGHKIQQGDTFSRTRRQALEWGVKCIDVKVCNK